MIVGGAPKFADATPLTSSIAGEYGDKPAHSLRAAVFAIAEACWLLAPLTAVNEVSFGKVENPTIALEREEAAMRIWIGLQSALVALVLAFSAAAQTDGSGIITLKSEHGFDETVARFEQAVMSAGDKGFRLYGRIDHAAAAAEVGASMPNSLVIIFGTPGHAARGFLAAPTLAIDGPLKALIWETAEGEVMVSYNSVEYIGGVRFPRHGLPDVSSSPEFGVLADNLKTFAEYAVN